MNWTLTRTDRANGAQLTRQEFPSIADLLASLRERGIPLTDAHAAEIEAHPETQFARTEMVGDGFALYSASVLYDLRPTEHVPPPPPPRKTMRCRKCGTVGAVGGYPFSTAPGTGYCDDCL